MFLFSAYTQGIPNIHYLVYTRNTQSTCGSHMQESTLLYVWLGLYKLIKNHWNFDLNGIKETLPNPSSVSMLQNGEKLLQEIYMCSNFFSQDVCPQWQLRRDWFSS